MVATLHVTGVAGLLPYERVVVGVCAPLGTLAPAAGTTYLSDVLVADESGAIADGLPNFGGEKAVITIAHIDAGFACTSEPSETPAEPAQVTTIKCGAADVTARWERTGATALATNVPPVQQRPFEPPVDVDMNFVPPDIARYARALAVALDEPQFARAYARRRRGESAAASGASVSSAKDLGLKGVTDDLVRKLRPNELVASTADPLSDEARAILAGALIRNETTASVAVRKNEKPPQKKCIDAATEQNLGIMWTRVAKKLKEEDMDQGESANCGFAPPRDLASVLISNKQLFASLRGCTPTDAANLSLPLQHTLKMINSPMFVDRMEVFRNRATEGTAEVGVMASVVDALENKDGPVLQCIAFALGLMGQEFGGVAHPPSAWGALADVNVKPPFQKFGFLTAQLWATGERATPETMAALDQFVKAAKSLNGQEVVAERLETIVHQEDRVRAILRQLRENEQPRQKDGCAGAFERAVGSWVMDDVADARSARELLTDTTSRLDAVMLRLGEQATDKETQKNFLTGVSEIVANQVKALKIREDKGIALRIRRLRQDPELGKELKPDRDSLVSLAAITQLEAKIKARNAQQTHAIKPPRPQIEQTPT